MSTYKYTYTYNNLNSLLQFEDYMKSSILKNNYSHSKYTKTNRLKTVFTEALDASQQVTLTNLINAYTNPIEETLYDTRVINSTLQETNNTYWTIMTKWLESGMNGLKHVFVESILEPNEHDDSSDTNFNYEIRVYDFTNNVVLGSVICNNKVFQSIRISINNFNTYKESELELQVKKNIAGKVVCISTITAEYD